MDEFDQVRCLLTEKPPPSPDVVAAARTRLEQAVRRGHVSRPRSRRASRTQRGGIGGDRHLPGWLVPAAAAGTVVAVVLGTLSLSSLLPKHGAAAHGAAHHIGRAASGTGKPSPSPSAESSANALASVPPYAVQLVNSMQGGDPLIGEKAQVRDTATGEVLGTVSVPFPSSVFAWVSAAANDRTFVFAVRPGTTAAPAWPISFYEVALNSSGRPVAISRLPIPPITSGDINGFALSPDGSKLAVSLLPAYQSGGSSQIDVFSVATGAARTWVWQGANGYVGWDKPDALSLSWENDNRTLLYTERSDSQQGATANAGAYLLDTATRGGSLLAASTRVPLPSAMLLGQGPNGITGPILISGDGSLIIAPTNDAPALSKAQAAAQRKAAQRTRHYAHHLVFLGPQGTLPPSTLAVSEFSVSTGKLVRILFHVTISGQAGTGAAWANSTGTIVITNHPVMDGRYVQPVEGVQTLTGFTPLPASLQKVYEIFW